MLFNSYEYIFFFLPLVYFIYFYLNKRHFTEGSKAFLVVSSLFFYGWWNIAYIPIILLSMIFNYIVGVYISSGKSKNINRFLFAVGIIFNLLLLGYFKYADFLIENINFSLGSNIDYLNIALPLAISFFTFQQIAYLVDTYKNEVQEHDFLNYAIFVTFFPQLIAGPIVHHKEMMPQFASKRNKIIQYKNISLGIFVFSIGLFKKVIIADTFAVWASNGFDKAEFLTFFEAWAVSFSYTFQIYFDFSGYTDMAIGAALLFNIRLPINFNSPYKALNIQDFWRRWHITLSRFLRDYIYIPLGGNRNGDMSTSLNLFATFLLGGIWHGAGWTFILWGMLHAFAVVIHRIYNKLNFSMNKVLAWIITFNFINITWIFFRAEDINSALKVLRGLVGLDGFTLHPYLENRLSFLSLYGIEFKVWLTLFEPKKFILILLISFLMIFIKNSGELQKNFRPNLISLFFVIGLLSYSILNISNYSDFLYFDF